MSAFAFIFFVCFSFIVSHFLSYAYPQALRRSQLVQLNSNQKLSEFAPSFKSTAAATAAAKDEQQEIEESPVDTTVKKVISFSSANNNMNEDRIFENFRKRNLEKFDLREKVEKEFQMYEIMNNYVLYLGEKNLDALMSLFENNGETALVYSTSPKCDIFPLLCPGPYPAKDFYRKVFDDELVSLELETYLLPDGYPLATYISTNTNDLPEEEELSQNSRKIGYGYTSFILKDRSGSFGGVYVDLFEFSELYDLNGKSMIKIKKVSMFENLEMPIPENL